MANDKGRPRFDKNVPVSSGGSPGNAGKPSAPPAKVITPIPLQRSETPPKKGTTPPAGRAVGDPPRSKAARLQPRNPGRLTSLDAFRGFVMLMLAAAGFGIAQFAEIDEASPVWQIVNRETWQKIAFHFEHPAWRSNFKPSFLEKALPEPTDPEQTPSADDETPPTDADSQDAPSDAADASTPPDPVAEGDPANTDHNAPAIASETEFLKFGVSFWDLIQPAFMFIVGVAMPFSNARRWSDGQNAAGRMLHAIWRAFALVLLGVFLYSVGSERTNWIFPNVLAQIGLGYAFAFVLLPLRSWVQIVILALVLGGYWGLFKANPPAADYNYAKVNASAERGEVYEGKFAPWSKNANIAHKFDVNFLNRLRTLSDEDLEKHEIPADARSWCPETIRKWFFANDDPFLFNGGGYQTLNFIPSLGTIILGILCGQLLLSTAGAGKKLGLLLLGGALCLVLGLAAGEFACPIVKRIWTPSWVLFSGGYVIWMLAAFYFVFDVLPLKILAFPLTVFGMNSLAVYLMGELLRGWTREKVVKIHLTGILETIFGTDKLAPDMFGLIIYAAATVFVFWLVTLWMNSRKIFVRL